MRRGLVLAKYGTLAASTRQRMLQMEPYLAAQELSIEIHPLFDDAYLAAFFKSGKHNPLRTVASYFKRLLTLLGSGKYDFIWVQYELFPYLPGWVEGLIRFTGKPVIYDFDDAIFHRYDQHPNLRIRRMLGKKIVPLLEHSTIAFCGNAYLETYAKHYCKRTEVIPTTVNIETYIPKTKQVIAKPTLGWIGSPSTWSYCKKLEPVFASFVQSRQLSVLVIGAGSAVGSHYGFELRDWSEAREVGDIQDIDIGIMPVLDDPWARGKCGYKLIQYMACGLPVIASPVGVNREIVEHGVNGFLATTEREWREAIGLLQGDADLRKRMGEAGRKKIVEQYSIQKFGPRVARLIQECCSHA